MKEEILKRILEMGLPQQEAEELYEVISEQVLDLLYQDAADKLSDDELIVIENRMKEAKSPEHFESLIKELAFTAYGENAQNEIANMYQDLVDTFQKTVEETKALLERANSGDSQAKELLNKAMETDIYQSITNTTE